MRHAVALMTDNELGALGSSQPDGGFGGLATSRGHLPLKSMAIEARITGLSAEMEVEQTFVNVHEEPIEATYIFPLPDRAAVTKFVMTVGSRTIEGVLKERGEARREYTAAIQQGHRAAITEEDRPGVFSMRVGNLMPGDIAVIHLSLTGPLMCADGEVTMRFPLVVAPRYIPGRPLPGASVGTGTATDTDAVPDASRISPPVLLPGFPSPVRLSIAVTLDPGGLAISDVRSSLHAITESTDASGARKLRIQPGERLDRDFILRFKLGGDFLSSGLVLEPDASGQGGTFMLTVMPPTRAMVGATKPRDVVFVLDRSGSMEGWKMVAARRAVGRMLDTLVDGDRFTVLAFDDHIEWPPGQPGNPSRQAAGQLIDASDRQRFRALEWLAGIDARGGTEMNGALFAAADALAKGDAYRDRVLVLATDGQVGDEDRIIKELAQRAQGMRVFAVGIDRAVNGAFLERLAAIGGGGWELVESEERLDESMDRIHRRIGAPVLTELTIAGEGLQIDAQSVVPPRLPDAFAGVPVVVLGRYTGTGGAGGAMIALYGAQRDGSRHTEALHGHKVYGAAARRAWARGRVRALEDRFAIDRGARPALEKEIVETSLEFGVLCRFTAFVAVDRAEVVNAGGKLHPVTQPAESPSGWGKGAAAPPPPQGGMAAKMPMRPAAPAPMQVAASLGGVAPGRSAGAPGGGPPAQDGAAGPTFGRSRVRTEQSEQYEPPAPPAEMELERKPQSMPAPIRMDDKKKEGRRSSEGAKSSVKDSTNERALVAKLLRSAADAIAVARDDGGKRRAIEALWMALVGVMESLRRKGTPSPEIEGLYAELAIAFTMPTAGDTAQLWAKAASVLATFAGVPLPVLAPGRDTFWK